MQNERNRFINVLKTNIPAIIVILIMTIALKIALDYNVILSFVVLCIAYVVLGIIVEVVLEKIEGAKTVREPVHRSERQARPKLVDLTDDSDIEIKQRAARRITTSPNAAEVAQRLRKTQFNFDDLLTLSDTPEAKKREEKVFTSKVSVINDYSTLLNKAKQAKKEPEVEETEVKSTVSVEKISDSEAYDRFESERTDIDESYTFMDDNDFTVRPAEDLESVSEKIKHEVEKRLSDSKKTIFPKRKKGTALMEDLTFDTQEEEEEIEKVEEVENLDDFKIERKEDKKEEEVLEDIFFEPDGVDGNDMAVADADLIDELYTEKEEEPKKKLPFWKNLFQ
ncbi:MAG: hypothetical protein GX166_03255 [Clostridiaceae bacterium]|nr:hypothetical protein [Clostridiaceae bacterium]